MKLLNKRSAAFAVFGAILLLSAGCKKARRPITMIETRAPSVSNLGSFDSDGSIHTLARIKVHGGWVLHSHGMRGNSMVFIPDPDYKWQPR